jgi:hypothetical protein
LQWDAQNKYLRIYVTPTSADVAGTHLVFDVRNSGFWPAQYPQVQGPLAVATYISGSLTGQNQFIVMGGYDGTLYYENPDYADDQDEFNPSAGTVGINAFATYQPVQFAPGPNFIFERLEVDGGEMPPNMSTGRGNYSGLASFFLQVQVVSGPTAADVSGDGFSYPTQDSTANSTTYQTWITDYGGNGFDRRQPTSYPRLLGSWFGITVSNGDGQGFFNIERIIGQGSPSGLNRFQR